jgi:hypothetical protein
LLLNGHDLFKLLFAVGHTGSGSDEPGGEGMWRRKKTGVIAVAAGAVLFVVGLADHDVSAEADCESFHEAFPRLVR